MILFELSKDDYAFPDIRQFAEEELDPNGLVAVGGDIAPDRLIEAYKYGFFPWFAFEHKEPRWYCPRRRFVIFPHEIHISHSMRTLLNKGKHKATFNTAFERVIRRCSAQRIHEKGAWLGEEMIATFLELHRRKYAYSVEVWDEKQQLIGGLYGMYVQHCFIGESMFSDAPNGSKIALIALALCGAKAGLQFIDCQIETPHLKSMGGRYITYDDYLKKMWG